MAPFGLAGSGSATHFAPQQYVIPVSAGQLFKAKGGRYDVFTDKYPNVDHNYPASML